MLSINTKRIPLIMKLGGPIQMLIKEATMLPSRSSVVEIPMNSRVIIRTEDGEDREIHLSEVDRSVSLGLAFIPLLTST